MLFCKYNHLDINLKLQIDKISGILYQGVKLTGITYTHTKKT